MNRIALSSTIIALLCGCQSPQMVESKDRSYITSSLETTLIELSTKAVQAKEIMLAHQAAMSRLNPEADKYSPNLDVPNGLEKVIPMDAFYGDALEPLRLIAKLTNYEYKEQGAKPSTEIYWVNIQKNYNRLAIDLLDDIANQIDKRGINIDVWETPNQSKYGVILVSFGGQ
ncbi:DotD/TraH family lipoprotein [Vibrio metschnikovii]|nr:DotD/TraH family lipoprotein [Vibrio metschnikovii]